MRQGAVFMPVAHLPGAGRRAGRVVWIDFDGATCERPFLVEDLAEWGGSRTWFVADERSLELVRAQGALGRRSPAGLVFHLSRCGSTLARRLFGVLPETLVLSEPAVLNQTLASPGECRAGELLATFAEIAARRRERVFVKCTSWNLLQADKLLGPRGGVPAIFIHREPGEVLASLHGLDRRARLPESLRSSCGATDPDESNAQHLEALMRCGLRLAEIGRVRCVSYPSLVDRIVKGDIPAFFGYEVDEATRSRMRVIAAEYSKDPRRTHRSDVDGKASIVAGTPSIRRAAARLKPLHEELERWSACAASLR